MQHRVLHILSGMERGGIETWIMNVMRAMDTGALRFDFLVEAAGPCSYDDEIVARGGRILRAPRFRHRGRFARRLAEVLRREGPYHAVHAHGRHDMGLPIAVAAALRVPVRIGHVHNITDHHDRDPLRRTYKRLMRRLLLSSATWILGCSTAALASLYGPGAGHAKLEMLPYGIDLSRFRRQDSRTAIARALDIAPDRKILGHVGRFVWEKNHPFLVEVLGELVRRDPAWVLVLVGDGPLRADTERLLADRGLTPHVRFTGARADVPALMSAMDVFAFPSHQEGFGLVMVEAQALGLPCVISQAIPIEVEVVELDPALVQRVDTRTGPAAWASAIERAAAAPLRAAEAHAQVARSRFAIERSVETLVRRYYNLGHAR